MKNDMTAKDRPRHKKQTQMGITLKLFSHLAVMIAIMMVVVWLFQVRLLNLFYIRSKEKELVAIKTDIIAHISGGYDVTPIASGHSDNSDVCIDVFEIEKDRAYRISSSCVSDNCIIHNSDIDYLNALYNKAIAHGGSYSDRFRLTPTAAPLSVGDVLRLGSGGISAVNISIVEINGSTYCIMLDSVLTPMNATVNTLRTQFFWITAIFSLIALIMAMIMSRNILRPIVSMNESAKQLAHGNYDVEFSGSGYREITELGETLEYAAHKLGVTDRLQKELISNVSHDLRTPLTMIKGYGEVIRDIPGENTPENVQVIIDEAERLSALVNDLLDLSKLEAGARGLDLNAFDLTDTVRETLKRYDRLIGHEGYSITFSADENVTVIADRSAILQVICNLMNNAVNYTGEDKTVRVIQTVNDGKVKITVSDTGEGIPEDKLDLIWERYYKIDKVHRRATVGSGVGLSIVKNILDMHHAVYGVKSIAGEGTDFWFELEKID